MSRPSWGHTPRRCVYCRLSGPRVVVVGGYAHRRCMPGKERQSPRPKPLHDKNEHRQAKSAYRPGMRFRENRPGYWVDVANIEMVRVPGSRNKRIIELVGYRDRRWTAAVCTEVNGTPVSPPRHVRLAERTLKQNYIQLTS